MAGEGPPSRSHSANHKPLKAPARDILADVVTDPLPEVGALLGGSGSDGEPAQLELEAVELSPQRFWQLALFATACFMSSLDWNILVRHAPCAPPRPVPA